MPAQNNKDMKAQEIIEKLRTYKSNIVLTEDHRYLYGTMELQGITGFIKKFIAPNQYANVSEETLTRARERGNNLHYELDFYVKTGIVPAFVDADFKAMHDVMQTIEPVESEYIVSDFTHFASPIDLLALVDGELAIIDLKAQSAPNIDCVTWQANIYRYLLKKQSAGTVDVKQYYCLQVYSGKAKLIPLFEISDENVEYMLKCASTGAEFTNPLTSAIANKEQQELKTIYYVCQAIADLEAQMKSYNEKFEQLKLGLIEKMKENGVKTFENDLIKLTYKAPSERVSLDTKAIKETYPEIYEAHKKTSIVKESLTIKIK